MTVTRAVYIVLNELAGPGINGVINMFVKVMYTSQMIEFVAPKEGKFKFLNIFFENWKPFQ